MIAFLFWLTFAMGWWMWGILSIIAIKLLFELDMRHSFSFVSKEIPLMVAAFSDITLGGIILIALGAMAGPILLFLVFCGGVVIFGHLIGISKLLNRRVFE